MWRLHVEPSPSSYLCLCVMDFEESAQSLMFNAGIVAMGPNLVKARFLQNRSKMYVVFKGTGTEFQTAVTNALSVYGVARLQGQD